MAVRLRQSRMVAGATASYEREAGLWRHDLWILSTPSSQGVELQAWTLGGKLAYAGAGRIAGEELTFVLRTVTSSGLALAEITGRLTTDSLIVEGTIGDRAASEARTPSPRQRPQ